MHYVLLIFLYEYDTSVPVFIGFSARALRSIRRNIHASIDAAVVSLAAQSSISFLAHASRSRQISYQAFYTAPKTSEPDVALTMHSIWKCHTPRPTRRWWLSKEVRSVSFHNHPEDTDSIPPSPSSIPRRAYWQRRRHQGSHQKD